MRRCVGALRVRCGLGNGLHGRRCRRSFRDFGCSAGSSDEHRHYSFTSIARPSTTVITADRAVIVSAVVDVTRC